MGEGVGKVYLIGAGPGDPGLLTLMGRRCLEEADVVVYDAAVSHRLLAHAKPSAELVSVGEREEQHALMVQEIGRLLVEWARAGKVVARLREGDAFVVPGGGEEAEALSAARIPFEVVPGLPPGLAAPAYAGIPLIYRGLTTTVGLVTGHEPGKADTGIAWDRFAPGTGTLVFQVEADQLPDIVKRLVDHGRSPDTPAALIRWGTRTDQAVLTGTLASLAECCVGMRSPAVIVVGDVVRLRERLRWFEDRPLFGKRVLITRAREQARAFTERLEAAGAEIIELPAIRIEPPETWEPLDAAVGRLREYQWVIFTSANGVRFFWDRLQYAGRDARHLFGITICAIGPATAAALFDRGLRADLVPAEFKAEGLVEAVGSEKIRGARVLLARAAEAREVIPEELAHRGATVDVVPAYRTLRSTARAQEVRGLLQDGRIHVVTFTSSSTVRFFLELVGEDATNLLQKIVVASIGPITARTAARHGIVSQIVPDEYTIPALADALVRHFQTPRS